MAAYSESTLDLLIKELIDVLLPDITVRLYNRQPLDSLVLLSLLATPGAVEYVQGHFHLKKTGRIHDLFVHYAYAHLTVDSDRYFLDGIQTPAIHDNRVDILKELPSLEPLYISHASQTACVMGNYDTTWYLLETQDMDHELVINLIFGMSVNGLDYTNNERLMSMLTSLNIPDSAYGFLGALAGAHIALADKYVTILGSSGPKLPLFKKHLDLVRVELYEVTTTSIPTEAYNFLTYADGFDPKFLSLFDHMLSDPRYKIWFDSPGFGYDIRRFIVEYGSQELINLGIQHKLIAIDANELQYANVAYFKLYEQSGRTISSRALSHLVHRAAIEDDFEILKYALSKGYDDWNAAMIDAASIGNLQFVKFFEAQGANDFQGAINTHQNIDVYNYLRTKGVDILEEPDPLPFQEDDDGELEPFQDDY